MTLTARAFPPPTPLRVVPPGGGVHLVGTERAATAFLTALGVATDAVTLATGIPEERVRAVNLIPALSGSGETSSRRPTRLRSDGICATRVG